MGEDKSSTSDDQLSVSYSEQLAEILPSTAPLDKTLLPEISEEDSSSGEDMPQYEISNDISDTVNRFWKVEEITHEALEQAKDKFCMPGDSNIPDMNIEDPKNSMENDYVDVADMKYILELDPEENLVLFYSQHSFKLTKLREERAELQQNICAFYKDVKSEMTSLEEKLCKLKKDFDEALSNDEYDLAAEINDQIEETNAKKFELECSRSKLLDKKIAEFFASVTALRDREKEFHQWSLTKYEDLQKQQNSLLEKHKQQRSHEIYNKKQELAHDKNKINRSLQHLQLDKEHVVKDKMDLDERIDSKLEVFQSKKKELVSKQEEIEGKIIALEKQLKGLRSERKEVDLSIQDQDDNMATVRKEFESVEKKLNERYDEVETKEELLNDKLAQICAKEKELDLTAAHEKSKEESLVKTIHYLTINKKESEAFIESTEKEPTADLADVYLTCLPKDHGDNLIKLKSLERTKAKELQDLELQVFNEEQVISTKRKRVNEIKTQIPDLESSKKLAVSDHNFKEAKRTNEMIKQLTHEVEELQRDLGRMEIALDENKQKTESMKQDYLTMKEDVIQEKEQHGLAELLRNINKASKITEISIGEDSLLDTLQKEEIDLLKTEFKFFQEPSESILSKMSEGEEEKMNFMRKLIAPDMVSSDKATKHYGHGTRVDT